MEERSSLERKIDQILSSGEGNVNRLFAVIDELLESEAYPSMQILFTRVLGDSVPQQVWLAMFHKILATNDWLLIYGLNATALLGQQSCCNLFLERNKENRWRAFGGTSFFCRHCD